MLTRHSVWSCANAALVLVLLEANVWRLANISGYVTYVSHVTLRTSYGTAGLLIAASLVLETCASIPFLRLKDSRVPAGVIAGTQLANYVLFEEARICVALSIVLCCLKVTEIVNRNNQSVSWSVWNRLEQVMREKATAFSISALLLPGVAFELVGVLLRLGENNYQAALARDGVAFSLSVSALALYLSSFDEAPGKYPSALLEALSERVQLRKQQVDRAVETVRSATAVVWSAIGAFRAWVCQRAVRKGRKKHL